MNLMLEIKLFQMVPMPKYIGAKNLCALVPKDLSEIEAVFTVPASMGLQDKIIQASLW